MLSTTPLGYMGGIEDIILGDESHLDYYGGETEELLIGDVATAYLYGGRIDGITSYQTVDWVAGEPVGQHIKLYCQPGWSWMLDNGQKVGIQGLWWDDSLFDIEFNDKVNLNFDPVWANIEVITPEPATLALLAFGGLLLRWKK